MYRSSAEGVASVRHWDVAGELQALSRRVVDAVFVAGVTAFEVYLVKNSRFKKWNWNRPLKRLTPIFLVLNIYLPSLNFEIWNMGVRVVVVPII